MIGDILDCILLVALFTDEGCQSKICEPTFPIVIQQQITCGDVIVYDRALVHLYNRACRIAQDAYSKCDRRREDDGWTGRQLTESRCDET